MLFYLYSHSLSFTAHSIFPNVILKKIPDMILIAQYVLKMSLNKTTEHLSHLNNNSLIVIYLVSAYISTYEHKCLLEFIWIKVQIDFIYCYCYESEMFLKTAFYHIALSLNDNSSDLSWTSSLF